ncbi:MAG: RNA recognition motif domain-containing protein [Minisyncoccota bacterium]
MAKKLYVGGLPYSTTNDELKEVFSKAGEVSSATVIIDKMSGRSRGFGFVEMTNDADADKAIEMFNDKELGGRKILVNEARPMEDRPKREGGFGGGRGGFGGGNRGGFGGGRGGFGGGSRGGY